MESVIYMKLLTIAGGGKYMFETNYTDEMSEKINRYMYLILIDLISKYNRGEYLELEPVNKDIAENGRIPVWVCWWQGLDSAPDIVKRCVESIYRYVPKDSAQIHFITFDNYMEYAGFSQIVVDRYNAGRISLTHLADILRVQLLNMYGGLWVDATYFISDNRIADIINDEAYTVKTVIPSWNGDVIAKGKWAVNFLKFMKGSPLSGFCTEAFEIYWSLRDEPLDYFLLDRIIKVAYDNIPVIRKQIDGISANNISSLKLMEIISNSYDEAVWNDMKKDTFAFKLSYKEPVELYTEDGKETFYNKLQHNIL